MKPLPLAIIPTYVRSALDIEVFTTTLRTLRETASDRCDVLAVDDGSPAEDLVEALAIACKEYDADFHPREKNEGFSRTVNIGLRQCRFEQRDAILVNADIEFGLAPDWLELMEGQERIDGAGPASVVGALLLYPNGLIQHAGVLFSMLARAFVHRFNYGPGDLPEAQIPTSCPVTGALQLIRHECLQTVGIYDESFKLGWEDVDYCIRTMLQGYDCVYQPQARAIHHESFFRSQRDGKIADWTERSWLRFVAKYANVNFAALVPGMFDQVANA